MDCDNCKFKGFCKFVKEAKELKERADDWAKSVFILPDEISILISCPHYAEGGKAK